MVDNTCDIYSTKRDLLGQRTSKVAGSRYESCLRGKEKGLESEAQNWRRDYMSVNETALELNNVRLYSHYKGTERAGNSVNTEAELEITTKHGGGTETTKVTCKT